MTTMYDSTNAEAIPKDATLCLGYMDADFAGNQAAIEQEIPDAKVVPVTCTAGGAQSASVFDCEPGNGNAASAATWALVKKQRGAPLETRVIYCARVGEAGYGEPDVRAACAVEGLVAGEDYLLGIADGTGEPHMAEGAGIVFTQYAFPGLGSPGDYDVSETVDNWPASVGPTPSGGITLEVDQLQNGSTGGQVKTAQCLLNKWNQGVAVDGDFGPATEAGVKSVQTYMHLTVDGIIGAQTWPVLVDLPT